MVKKAADRGDARALNSLGDLYERGNGVKQDVRKAANCFRRAAEQGHAEAQLNLSRMYMPGSGLKSDLIEAYKWLYLASKNGYGEANGYMMVLNQRLTPDEVGQACRRAEEFNQSKRNEKSSTYD